MLGNNVHVTLIVRDKQRQDRCHHPLHVDVSRMAFTQHMGGEMDERDSFIGSLLVEEASNNVFVTVNFSSSSDEDSSSFDQEYLELYVTELFLQHYHLQQGKAYTFKVVNCFPITRVILGARTQEAYSWANSKEWHENLLSAITSSKNPRLCRMDDVFLVAPDMFNVKDVSLLFGLCTLDIEPVEQGVLTLRTKVVVVDMSKSAIDDFVLTDCSTSVNPSSESKQIIDGENSSDGYVQRIRAEECGFQVEVLSAFGPAFISALEDCDVVLDPFNTVFLASQTACEMGAETGDWVKICKRDRNESVNDTGLLKFRYATVCSVKDAADFHPNADAVYIPPQLFFNLNEQPSVYYQDCVLTIEVCDAGDDYVPPYAKEVFVALVQSPNYSGAINCETILKSYFKDTRYICKGDIICIDAKDSVDFCHKDKTGCSSGWPVVYFRVSVIEGPVRAEGGYLIDSTNTRLYQAGTAQSYIPATVEVFYSPCIVLSLFDSASPSGLDYYVDLMEEIMLPILNILNNKIQVSSNILLTGNSGCGKSVIVRAVCKRLNLHFYQVNCHEMSGDTSGSVEAKLRVIMERAHMFAPCITLLKNIDVIGKEMELKGENSRVLSNLGELLRNTNMAGRDWPCVIVATTSSSKCLNEDLASAFLQEVYVQPPSESERSAIIEGLLSGSVIGPDVDFDFIAKKTAGFELSDLCALVTEAKKIDCSRSRSLLPTPDLKLEEDLKLARVPLVQEDILAASEKLQVELAKMANAPKIPNIIWEDVGGLNSVKQEVIDTIMLPMEHPEILSTGLRRAGILLYGPPGTGKTLIAKAVATECSMSFISVKGPELLNMYVGQSEENVRAVFSQARAASPCIVFFDELDSLAPNRGRSGDSTGVMDRVVSQLLAELDGLNKSTEVFAIGATNRPDLVDPALLRPGRFDRLVYVGIPSDMDSRMSVMKALTRKMPLHADVDFMEILSSCPKNLSGADFYSLCNDAMMSSAQRNIEKIEKGELTMEDAECLVCHQDFMQAISVLCPSVSEDQLLHYEVLKGMF